MSEQKRSNEDTYEALHKNFSLFGDDDRPEQPEISDVKNCGEIYFSANSSDGIYMSTDKKEPSSPVRSSAASARPVTRSDNGYFSKPSPKPIVSTRTPSTLADIPVKTSTAKKTTVPPKSKGKSKKKNSYVNVLLSLIVVACVLLISFIVRIPVMGCVNDILAIDRSSTQKRVTISEGMDTSDIIELLADKDLVYSSTFCKLACRFLDYYDNDFYPAGEYDLSADMGVEGMLREILSAGKETATVSLTFPEGFTIDQIIDRLSGNGVSSKNALYQAFASDTWFEQYDFLSGITDKVQRYHALEGYLYPDTYEFYIGEDPMSVVKRFLDNFAAKWEENFAAKLEKTDYTMDEILTVASILEKEAKDAEQMPLIASVIYNRLRSSSFPFINCDSTAKYIENAKDELEKSGTYETYYKLYDTYQKTGLPLGPICNPGLQAIAAALSPDNTDYYYFLHDADGKIYMASTVGEHQANQSHIGASSNEAIG